MSQERDERELRETARLLVAAGLQQGSALEERFTEMVRVQMPETDPVIMARGWLLAARRQRAERASSWPSPSDHDRLSAAFEDCRAHGVAVLEGVDDLAEVRRTVESAQPPLRGVLWFSEQAVFDAVDQGVLRAGLRHGNGMPAQPGDSLGEAVVRCLQCFGLLGRAVPGGVEVATWWQRRP